jgi:REP element-mobilizing transposase RayT
MDKPLVIAYHLMWTAYGHWLPNDPRGSTSKTVTNPLLAELGELHFGRREIQPAIAVLREFKSKASQVLKYPVLKITISDFDAVGRGISHAIEKNRYTCYACAFMPDHVHLLIRKHKDQAEEMIKRFQESSRLYLSQAGIRTADHPTWTDGGWKVFLYHPLEIHRTIRYIEQNPVKWRLPSQKWPFVVEYDDWPLHPGHSPNSPYARGLNNYAPKSRGNC